MTRNYKRKTDRITLNAAYAQGFKDFYTGRGNSNPYSQQMYQARYNEGYEDAILELAFKSKIRKEQQENASNN